MNKDNFHELLGRAISSPSKPRKPRRLGGYSGKKTRSHTTAGASAKRRGTSRPKTA